MSDVWQSLQIKNWPLHSTATPEPIHNNTDIIEIDESTTIYHLNNREVTIRIKFELAVSHLLI